MTTAEVESILGEPLAILKNGDNSGLTTLRYICREHPHHRAAIEKLTLDFKKDKLVAYNYYYNPTFILRLRGERNRQIEYRAPSFPK